MSTEAETTSSPRKSVSPRKSPRKPAAATNNNKRKLDNDSEDEELLQAAIESEKKQRRTESPAKKPDSASDENTKPTEVLEAAKKAAEPFAKSSGSPLPSAKTALPSGRGNSPSTAAASETAAVSTVPLPLPKVNLEDDIQNYLVEPKWKRLLQGEFDKEYFQKINKFVKEEYKKGIVRPPKNLIFNAFNSTPIEKIKVVIIGQDPYHDDGQAMGLCFSVPQGIPLPPSLRNIFKELQMDIPDFERDEKLGGNLQKWTSEGVFLLNAFLTVEAHKAASHSHIGWDKFTDHTIKLISDQNNGCAFIMWGKFAQNKENLVNKKKHCIIKSAHPSPLSMKNFFGSKPFSKANAFLKSIGKTPVNWSLK